MSLRHLLVLSLLPITANAAAIHLGDFNSTDDIAPTEILNEHRKSQPRGDSIRAFEDLNLKLVNKEPNTKNFQAFDWFQTDNNTFVPHLDLHSLGTPVPEPSGNLLLVLAGLALTIRRRR